MDAPKSYEWKVTENEDKCRSYQGRGQEKVKPGQVKGRITCHCILLVQVNWVIEVMKRGVGNTGREVWLSGLEWRPLRGTLVH